MQLRFREIDRGIFDSIKSGEKSVETRAATPRFVNIKKGDVIVFACGKDKFEKKVKNVNVFRTIPELLKAYGVKQINPKADSRKDLEKMYYSFPGYRQKIKERGLIAMEFE